ncbi:MAG: ATP-dependent helicase [Halobacteriales archaeon]|nr:ATP-dependent helicase [Halobacteriales archaeon]
MSAGETETEVDFSAFGRGVGNDRCRYAVEVGPDVAFYGPPGTGKTTTLMRVLEQELRSGVDPHRVAGATYTTAMAGELADRAEEVVGEIDRERSWFRTTHSAAFRLLGLSKDHVMHAGRVNTFAEANGYEGTVGEAPEAPSPWVGALGSSSTLVQNLLAARSYCLNAGLDPRAEWRHATPALSFADLTSLTDENVERFNDEYEAWKDERGFYDYDDMLLEVVRRGLVPDVDVLIEDEFQDKTPLQVEVYNTWAEHIPTVYVAGDPYQAIYTFSGADPSFFQDAFRMAERSELLDVSYRLGPDLVDVARRTLRGGGYTLPEIQPTGEASVRSLSWDEYARRVHEHAEDDTFHLYRSSYGAKKVSHVLDHAGIPWQADGYRWGPKQVAQYNGVAKAARAIESAATLTAPDFSGLTEDETVSLLEVLPAKALRRPKGASVEHVERGEWSLAECLDIGTAAGVLGRANPFRYHGDGLSLTASALPYQDRLARAYEARDGEPLTAESFTHSLSTIHAAKGKEADVVFLLRATNKYFKNQPRAEEARVWYVGATRARETLYIVDCPWATYTTRML